jgi:hypothetical protein
METASLTSYLQAMKIVFLSIMTSVLLLAGQHALAADLLESMVGKKQPLLLFAKSRSFAPLDRQLDLLRDYRPDLSDRDMVVLRTVGSMETSAAIGYVSINSGAARLLHKRFSPDLAGLTVILIGKDGEEKARWLQVVEPQEIFDLIDTMPEPRDKVNQPVETQ